MCRESAFVPGAGATEIELARLIQDFGSKMSGLDQYAAKAFGEALEVVPRTLAANSGNPTSSSKNVLNEQPFYGSQRNYR